MALSIWKEWKNGQKEKVNEPVPLVLLAQQTSRNERQSGVQNMPKETVRPATILKSNSHHTQDLSYKKPTCVEKPTSVYKPHKNIHPYNPSMKHKFISTELGYKFTGNQYPIGSKICVDTDIKNVREEGKKKKEDNIGTGLPSASTNSGASK